MTFLYVAIYLLCGLVVGHIFSRMLHSTENDATDALVLGFIGLGWPFALVVLCIYWFGKGMIKLNDLR